MCFLGQELHHQMQFDPDAYLSTIRLYVEARGTLDLVAKPTAARANVLKFVRGVIR
jgi:hypothetical protein